MIAQAQVRLTKREVDKLKTDGRDRVLWDSEVHGFGLRISPAGALTYVLQYRFEGRQRRFEIGTYGSPWTPETARQEAQVLLGKKDGTHVTDLQACWVRIRKAAGLEDVRIHDLRHSFASIAASTGDGMLIIGALLGHRSAKTTERYTHLSGHPLKSAAERISNEIARHLGEAMSLPAANDTSNDDPFETFWAIEPVSETHASDPVLGAVIRTQWLDTRAAAAMLGFTVGTMQTCRWMGTGPAFRKIGRRVVYSADALQAWQEAQLAGQGMSDAA